MKVKAAVAYQGRQPLVIEDLDVSEPGPDGILVRIVGAGLCHTDLKVRDPVLGVPQPVVLGHEGAGVVEQVGERVTTLQPGDHVVLTYDSCGACGLCRAGHPANCEQWLALNLFDARSGQPGSFRKNGQPIHGHFFGQSSFANYAVARPQNAIPVPRNAPLEILGALGCGVQTGAGAVMNVFLPRDGGTIAVFGVGSVGLSAVLGAVVCGCSAIVAVDVLEPRLKMARQLGATHAVLAQPGLRLADEILNAVPGGVDYALDTTGRVATIQQAVASLALRGQLGLVGIPEGSELGVDLSAAMGRGLTIGGIVEGDGVPSSFIPHLIDLHLAGRFPFDKFVTRYPFEAINQAIADQAGGKVVKPVFTFPA